MRKRTRRKVYEPVNPLALVMTRLSKLTREEINKLQAINHAAMHSLVHGNGTHDDWQIITSALNMCVVMDDMVYALSYSDELAAAIEAHAECGVRFKLTGKLGYTGVQLNAVNLALEIHDRQLEQATVAEIEDAINEVNKRCKDPNKRSTVMSRVIKQSSNQDTGGSTPSNNHQLT